jgi:hypothetical protein
MVIGSRFLNNARMRTSENKEKTPHQRMTQLLEVLPV